MKKLILFYLLIFLLGCAMKLNAQTTQLETLHLKDTVLQNYARYSFLLNFIFNNPTQLSNFKGLENYNEEELRIKSYKLNFLFEGFSDSSKVFFLVVGNRDKYQIKIDTDLDLDFSNNTALTKKEIDEGIILRIRQNNVEYQRKVRIYPFDTLHKMGSAEEQKWQMTISKWPVHKFSILTEGLSSKMLFLTNLSLIDTWNKKNTILYSRDYDKIYNNHYFTYEDSIYFARGVYILDSVTIDGAKAFFKKQPRNGNCGNEIGDSLCIEDSIKTITGKSIDLKSWKGQKPVVFHFWGSWCGPCLTELPALEELITRFSDKCTFINVAYEQSEKYDKLFSILKRYPQLSNNVIENSKKPILTNRFNIANFPSYVIVSEDGIIVSKLESINPLKQLESILSNF